MNKNMEIVDIFLEQLRLQKYENEYTKVEETLKIIEQVVSEAKWNNLKQLLDHLNTISNLIQTKLPWDTTPHNTLLRAIKLVKDECSMESPAENSIVQSFSQKVFSESHVSDSSSPLSSHSTQQVKNDILESLMEYKAEIEQYHELICKQGETKIHSDEIILTCGYCKSVVGFLLRAAKKRKFHVIVAECAPKYDGHRTSKLLSSAGIQTTLIPDCAIFSFMSRVNKVIIGCQTVFCNGGITTFVGGKALATAAMFYSVPLFVCSPTYKFTNEMYDEDTHFGDPASITPKGDFVFGSQFPPDVSVTVATSDYVPPENVTSFITNNQDIAPSYVYRQVMELYDPSVEDV